MQFGIVTPVLTLLPGAHARWEEDAPFSDVVAIAHEAERLGYHHLTCSEHVGVPVKVAEVRGGRYYDPLATLGFIAAATSTIRLASHVLVLGYHHPLEIAKRYGTLDRVSGGRLILGVGVGSLQEEFELLDVRFDDRGARADDAMRALRASMSQSEPSYSGDYYEFSGFLVDPCAVQDRVPLWVGGQSYRSLRRAMELGDGWVPFGFRSAELATLIERARDEYGRTIDLVLQNERPFDPSTEPDRVAEQLQRFADAGATHLNVRFVHHSPAHYREQLAALIDVAATV